MLVGIGSDARARVASITFGDAVNIGSGGVEGLMPSQKFLDLKKAHPAPSRQWLAGFFCRLLFSLNTDIIIFLLPFYGAAIGEWSHNFARLGALFLLTAAAVVVRLAGGVVAGLVLGPGLVGVAAQAVIKLQQKLGVKLL